MPFNADDIINAVDQRELDTMVMRDRMDDDYSAWWRSDEHVEPAGYRRYTSAESRIYAKKMIASLSQAAMMLTVSELGMPRATRDLNNAKEKFFLGGFRQNDERLARMDEPDLRSQIAFHSIVRGRTCGRALLVRDERTGRTYMDATPWDPRHVMWEMGPDGLEWICHKYTRSPNYIRRAYGRSVNSERDERGNPRQDVLVYDFYDRERNQVVIPAIASNRKMVKNLEHGLIDRVPAWIASNPAQPPIIHGKVFDNSSSFNTMMGEYGDSIFAENRRVWEVYNEMMSIVFELIARARKPPLIIRSPDGLKVLEFDPYKEGATLSLRNDEEIISLDLLTASPDTGAFMTIISGEMQRGALPPIMFGDSPLAISGFAMNTLRGSIHDKIIPHIVSNVNALNQICDIWSDQFVFGDFDGMELSGQGTNREWFNEFITPEMIADLPRQIIELTPVIPQDDASKMQMAQLARQPGPNGLPLYSDIDIHEMILQDQNADQIMAGVISEKAHTMNPFAMLDMLIQALMDRGDEQTAAYYESDKMELLQAKLMAMQQGIPIPGGAPPAGGAPQGGGSGGGNGLSPSTMPNAAQGQPPPNPVPQQGPLQAPGQPRPGAQNRTPQGPGAPV